MGKALEKPHAPLYERDFYAWLGDQAARLRARSHNELDWENLAEEIDSVGRSQKHEIRNRLKVLLQHLLKWEFQPERRSHSWQSSIFEQRTHIQGILSDSPSLRTFPIEAAAWAYPPALRAASLETRLPLTVFPEACPYTIEQILDETFMPGRSWTPDDLVRD